jgi:4-diphosphocytidyl-2-C-methyl-D-erythritol kinase
MEEKAYAKLNLALHVRGREEDGYHRIETLFAFAEDGDRLRVIPSGGLTLHIEGPFAAALEGEPDNLVLRAARALRRRFGIAEGAALALEKSLPVASGLGGGSADAAAALRLLNRFWRIEAAEAELMPLARALGADVPACLLSRSTRGEGRGDVLSAAALPGVDGAPLLLVNPNVRVSTADVFARWDGHDGGRLPPDIGDARNDLEKPARSIAPVIGEVLAELRGARFARMSGSGATCFGLYDDAAERDADAARIAAAHRDWWVLPSRFRAPPVP